MGGEEFLFEWDGMEWNGKERKGEERKGEGRSLVWSGLVKEHGCDDKFDSNAMRLAYLPCVGNGMERKGRGAWG